MKKISKFIVPIVLILIGLQFSRLYLGSNNELEVSNLKRLITNGIKTNATLNNEYKLETIKVLGVPTQYYTYTYSFFANGSIITGEYTFEKEQNVSSIDIKYLPENPSINSVNPLERIAFLTKAEGSNSALYIGLGLILIGIYLGYSAYKKP
jgi:hypothetical protein